MSGLAIHGRPASGMQYTQRRLHRSVTETRRYVIGRRKASTSGCATASMRSIITAWDSLEARRVPPGAQGLVFKYRVVHRDVDLVVRERRADVGVVVRDVDLA